MDAISSTSLDSANKPQQTEIAALARQLWEDAGRPAGRDLALWLEAEQRLQGLDSRPAGALPAGPERDTLYPLAGRNKVSDGEPTAAPADIPVNNGQPPV